MHDNRRLPWARWTAVLALSAITLVGHSAGAIALDDDYVDFVDSRLEACVATALGLPTGDPVPHASIAALESLKCQGGSGRTILSLGGLEHATQLKNLDLTGALAGSGIGGTLADQSAARLTALEPLRGLPNLTDLRIAQNYYSRSFDLAVLSSLPALRVFETETVRGGNLAPLAATSLTHLAIGDGTNVSSLAPLTAKQDLVHLEVAELNAQDLTPLTELTALESLILTRAQATALPDLHALSRLHHVDVRNSAFTSLGGFAGTDLRTLDMSSTAVKSLESVRGAAQLEEVTANNAGVKELGPLAGKTSLRKLSLTGNGIRDISALADLPALDMLDLRANAVSDVSVVSGLTSLTFLRLDDNAVTDISPLASAPSLGEWSALRQRADREFIACKPVQLDSAVSYDGTALRWSASSGMGTASEHVFTATGLESLRVTAPDQPFNVYLSAWVRSAEGPCTWPASWPLPRASFTLSDTVGVPATVTVSSGDVLPAPQATVTWRDAKTGQWIASGPSYTPRPEHAGLSVVPIVDYWSFGVALPSVTGPARSIKATFPTQSPYRFLNSPVAGTGASLDYYALPAGGTERCTWLLAGTTVKTGACSYGIPANARGKKLEVRVTASAPHHHSKTYSVSGTVLGYLGGVRTPGEINRGAATSTADVGATLKASPPTLIVAPATTRYQWLRDGSPIAGATHSTYRLTRADAGTRVDVRFTQSRSGYAPVTSRAIVPITVRKSFTSTPAPAISGTPTVGNTLTASTGTWSPKPSSLSYQWHRDGKAISGATNKTYKATSSDAGRTITVKVTAKRSGYSTKTTTSPAVTVKRKLTAATPTITGTAKVGETLTVKRGVWGPGTVATKVQWYVNGKAVSGATGSTYKVKPADAYATITVKVTGSRSGYTAVTRASAAKTPVGITYANCTAMKKHYPHGVARSKTAIDMMNGSRGGPITSQTFVSAKLYDLNAKSDRDKDGWACEP